ncbi:hypothetical protein D3C81_1675330 [compost metagenome]
MPRTMVAWCGDQMEVAAVPLYRFQASHPRRATSSAMIRGTSAMGTCCSQAGIATGMAEIMPRPWPARAKPARKPGGVASQAHCPEPIRATTPNAQPPLTKAPAPSNAPPSAACQCNG